MGDNGRLGNEMFTISNIEVFEFIVNFISKLKVPRWDRRKNYNVLRSKCPLKEPAV